MTLPLQIWSLTVAGESFLLLCVGSESCGNVLSKLLPGHLEFNRAHVVESPSRKLSYPIRFRKHLFYFGPLQKKKKMFYVFTEFNKIYLSTALVCFSFIGRKFCIL